MLFMDARTSLKFQVNLKKHLTRNNCKSSNPMRKVIIEFRHIYVTIYHHSEENIYTRFLVMSNMGWNLQRIKQKLSN